MWRRFLPGGVVLEDLLLVVICSARIVSASAPAFASFHQLRPGHARSSVLFASGCFAAVPVWRMLCRRRHVGLSLLRADALPSWLVDRVNALPSLLGRIPWHPERCGFCLQVRGVGRVLCFFCVALLLFVLSLCFLVCVHVFLVFFYF